MDCGSIPTSAPPTPTPFSSSPFFRSSKRSASQRTGYGILDVCGNDLSPVAWGVIRTDSSDAFPDRLYRIHEQLSEVIRLHRPTEAAVENVFLARNPASALKLGQARGAALVPCRAVSRDLPP